MTLVKYKKIFSWLALLLGGMALLQILALVLMFLLYGSNAQDLVLNPPGGAFFSRSFSLEANTGDNQATRNLASLIVKTLLFIMLAYVEWQASRLFSRLSQGETPFNHVFIQSLERLAKILIVVDILIPILYSIVLSFIMGPGNYYIQIGLTSIFAIGAILYGFAAILKYGSDLQKLADETV